MDKGIGSLGPELTKSAAANAANSDTSGKQLAAIQQYLDDLGSEATDQNCSTLATGCQSVLEGRGDDDLKQQVLNTIVWQEKQMMRVNELLHDLIRRELISSLPDGGPSEDFGGDYAYFTSLFDRFEQGSAEFVEMMGPRWKDGCIDAVFDDATYWLVTLLVHNHALSPSTFKVDEIQACVFEFLRETRDV